MPTRLVLDTNVVLDWLVFAATSLDPLAAAVATGRVRVLTHLPALDELQRVLGYPVLKLEPIRQSAILVQYRSQTCPATLPTGFAVNNLLLPGGFPRCRDVDDQPFLALAFHAHATLVSRDRQLLRLARRVAPFGLQIMSVEQLLDSAA
ncbi:MAG: putative toxin-antitoxin system toxin component, PIN family [Steroidobacteraceae bacterium]